MPIVPRSFAESSDQISKVEIVLGWAPSQDTVHVLPGADGHQGDQVDLRNKTLQDVAALIRKAQESPVDRFVILARSPQRFMQCLCKDVGWILEKREDDEALHFRALGPPVRPPQESEKNMMDRIFAPRRARSWHLSTEQVAEALTEYLLARPEPDWLEWENVSDLLG